MGTYIILPGIIFALLSSCGVGDNSDVGHREEFSSKDSLQNLPMNTFMESHYTQDEPELEPELEPEPEPELEPELEPKPEADRDDDNKGSESDTTPGHSVEDSETVPVPKSSVIDPGCTPIKDFDDPCVWKLWIQTRWGRAQYQIAKNGGNVLTMGDAGWLMHHERGRVEGIVAPKGSLQLDQVEQLYDVWLLSSRLKTLKNDGIDPEGNHADAVKYRQIKQLAEEANSKYYSALESWLKLLTGREPDMVPLIEAATYDPTKKAGNKGGHQGLPKHNPMSFRQVMYDSGSNTYRHFVKPKPAFVPSTESLSKNAWEQMTLEQIKDKESEAQKNKQWYARNAWSRLWVVKKYAIGAEATRAYAREAYQHYGLNAPTIPAYTPRFELGGPGASEDSYVPIPFLLAVQVVPLGNHGILSYRLHGRLRLVENGDNGLHFSLNPRYVNKNGNLVHERDRYKKSNFTDKIQRVSDPNEATFGGNYYKIDRNSNSGFTVKFHHRSGTAGKASDMVVYEFDSNGNLTSLTVEAFQ